jgi:hypothetical protein
LTEDPVTVFVADLAVVVVLVDGEIVVVVLVDGEVDGEVAGVVVLVDGDIVAAAPEVVGGVDEETVASDTGEEPALPEDPFGAVALEVTPRVRGADLVWNTSTPASPAKVATATIGARFMAFVSLA